VLLLGFNRGLGLRPFQKSKQRFFLFVFLVSQGYLCLALAIYFESCHVQDAGKNSFISFSSKNDESDKKRRYRSSYLYIFCFQSHFISSLESLIPFKSHRLVYCGGGTGAFG